MSVRALCGVRALAGAEVIGGRAGLDRQVRSVTAISTLAAADTVGAGAFVIAAPGAVERAVIDMLVRASRASGAVAFLVPEKDSLVSSTARLADKLGFPVLTASVSDPFQLAQQLDRAVHAADLERAEVISRLARLLHTLPATPERILNVLTAVLSARTALFGADGAALAGDELSLPGELMSQEPEARGRGIVRFPARDQRELILVPITLSGESRPALWLAVEVPPGPRSRTQTAEDAAVVASWAVLAWAAGRRLDGERDARERTQLLSAMLDKPGVIDRALAERVLRVGWQLEGWHTGVYLRMAGPSDGPLARHTDFLHRSLSKHGLSGPLVERALGWALWLTTTREPPATSYRHTAARLHTALTSTADELSVVAGVGRPCAGAKGIVTTLKEAHQASLLARTGGPGVKNRVAHIDELGLQRLLADWYASESFQSYARQLLEPVHSSGGETLLATVETYLEHESSTSITASVLGVHRNTVSDRIARAERLLAVDLSASDDRLVVQLACRTYRLGAVGEASRAST